MPSTPLLYNYTSRDLLDEPQYYMYSPYGGTKFLRDYLVDRRYHVAELETLYLERIDRGTRDSTASELGLLLSKWGRLARGAQEAFSPTIQAIHTSLFEAHLAAQVSETPALSVSDLGMLPEVPTTEALTALLRCAIDRNASEERELDQWLRRFLKRFEVTKKLYSAYTPAMKRASRDFGQLANYVLLSLSLNLHYEQTENLKMLNGALKLNDLLCSARARLARLEDMFLAIISLRKEVDIVRDLSAAQETPL